KINFKQGVKTFFPQLIRAELGKDQIKYFLTYSYYDYELSVRADRHQLVFQTNTKGEALFDQLLDWFQRRIEKYPHDLVFLTQEGRAEELRRALEYHKITTDKV